jgi:ABC-type multidrug transport system ATPase subunit
LLAAGPNVLLLDEPSNDLDIDTLAALEDLLDGWPGSLVVASHDRYLVERLCDAVFAMYGDGRLVHLPGGVEEYLSRLSTVVTSPAPRPARDPAADPRAAKKELARLERQLNRLEQREVELHNLLAEHATDYEKVTALDTELRAVRAERSDVEDSWLAVAEALSDG